MSCGCNLRKRINKEKIEVSKRDVYLDYNATTKPDIDVLANIDRLNRNHWGNPSAQNSRGANLYNYLLTKIYQCKKALGIPDYETYFDTSSTSIINRIIESNSFNDVITTSIEHPSLLHNTKTHINVDKLGHLSISELKNKLSKSMQESVIIYSPVNHETGNIQYYKEIYIIAREYNTPVIFDAVQTFSRIEIDKWLPYCDGFYFSGHKIHSIQGAAVLFIKKNIINFKTQDSPLPFSLYSGTFNTSSAYGLLEATIKLQKIFSNYIRDLKVLHSEALKILNQLEYIKVESERDNAPGIINISLSKIESIEELLLFLNRDGIQTGRLSACSGDINMISYVLKNMGRDDIRSKNTIRLSFGKDSRRDDFFRVTSSLKKYYNKL